MDRPLIASQGRNCHKSEWWSEMVKLEENHGSTVWEGEGVEISSGNVRRLDIFGSWMKID